jgi:tetratricopeptide (TPR) repeat protein
MAEISLQEYCKQVKGMIDQGRYMEAVAHGKHILGTYPKYVAAYRLLGRAMIEARQDDHAIDMFLRVLSADPEDMLAWVAMSEIYDRRDELSAAVWCMERAFEVSVDNQLVEEELRQLYGRRDGFEPERAELTRGSLARLYLRGDLFSRAISEFRAILAEDPDRVDLEAALAEALWRNEQRLEASEVCQKILDKLPYCLKANLILGEIWISSGREEGQTYLRRAEALDPMNAMAQEFFGDASPLQPGQAMIAPLKYRLPTGEERPAWMAGVEVVSAEGPPLTEREAALVDIAAALEAQIEIPSWLEEIDVEEAAEEPVVPEFALSMEEPEEPEEAEEPAAAPVEQIPEWMAGVGEGLEAAVEVEGVGQAPGAEFIAEEEKVGEIPDWLAGLSSESLGKEGAPPGEEPVPDFLSEIAQETFAEEPAPSEEEVPDWLAGLREQVVEEAEEGLPSEEAVPAAAEIPDWMQELAPPEAAAPGPAPEAEAARAEAAEAAPPAAEEVAPSWLEGEGMPSGEEALAWLEGLATGKEEELQAQVEAEIEARTAEIMGRPKVEEPAAEALEVEEFAPAEEAPPVPAAVEIPDWIQELAPPEAAAPAPPAEEPVPSVAEEAFGWTAFGEPEVGVTEEVAPEVEEVAPMAEEPVPSVAEEPVPSMAEEAFGWTAFGELEEGVAEEVVAGEVEEAAPVAERPVPSVAEEAFGWTAFGELEEGVAEEVVAGEVEEAAPMAERPVPSMAEEPVPGVTEEAFGWTAFGEPEEGVAEEVAAGEVEEAVPVAERPVPSMAEEPVPSIAEEAFGWTAFGEPEAGVGEEVVPAMEEVTPEMAVAPPVEEEVVPPVVEEVAAVEVAPPPAAEEPVVPAAEVAPPAAPPPSRPSIADPFAVQQAYLKENPRDYDARLNLARALWQAGRREEAMEAYGRLVRAGKLLDVVITELEEYLEKWPSVTTQRVLGDAYMKSDRLGEALVLYRQALENL